MNLGRKPDLERMAWMERVGWPRTAKHIQQMTPKLMDQLRRCKSDEARRLLLGVSK
jgi:hypothetical protein